MIAFPEGWRRTVGAGAEVAVNAAGTVHARYTSRTAPLRSFAAVVEAAHAEMPEWRTESGRRPDARERLVTAEGEHAFGLALAGRWLGAPAQRYVGAVYGDDTASILDLVALGEVGTTGPLALTGRALLVSATLQLGTRTRRYFYRRPEGWHGHATGLVTHWFPAEFPARPTTLVVYPATPTHEEPFAVYDALVRHERAQGARIEIAAPTATVTARDGLAGVHWAIECHTVDRVVHRDLIVLARAPFTYALQLDAFRAADPGARAALLALARSVEPVPAGPGAAARPTAGAGGFAHLL